MDSQLNPEAKEILEAFKNKRVMHLKLREAIQQLVEIENPSYEQKIVVFVGPTGAGKSTALMHLIRVFNNHYLDELIRDPSFLPTLYLSLPTGITGDFNWKDAFIRMLEAINEPLIARKVIAKYQAELDGDIVTNLSRLVASELRRAVRNSTKARRTKVMLLDEASSLFTASSQDSYLLQFELVKSLVNEIKSRIILCGAYDLLKIEDFNGQLIRRTRIVHFERYRREELVPDNKYGNAFRDAIASLLEGMPIPKEEGLLDHAEYFLLKSLGCIGLLKDWLLRALEAALKLETPILTRGILRATEIENRHLQRIFKEVKLGEEKLKDISDSQLADELGFEIVPSLWQMSAVTGADRNIANLAKGNRHPGKRNPSRDAVGENVNV